MRKNIYKTVKRQVTLIEMMIVMFLIAMIIGVVAYNYQGSMEEGKAFKTKTAMEKLSTVLTIAISNDPELEDNLDANWKEIASTSPIVQNPKEITKDGWGNDFDVSYEDDRIFIRSERYNEYLRKHPASAFKNDSQE